MRGNNTFKVILLFAVFSLMIPGYAIQSAEASPPILGIAGGFSSPHGVTVDSSGDVYVADRTAGKVIKCNEELTICEPLISGLCFPVGVAVNSISGDVYVSEQNCGKVKRFDSSGTLLLASAGGFVNTRGLAVNSTGNVYVAEQFFFPFGNSKLKTCTFNLSSCPIFVSGLNLAHYVAVDSSDNVYVSEVIGDAVKKFNSDGVLQATSPSLDAAIGVAVDSSGNVYVSQQGAGIVKKCTSDLSTCTTFVSGLGSSLQDLAVDSSGNVYVVDNSARQVIKFGVAPPPTPQCDGIDATIFKKSPGDDTSNTFVVNGVDVEMKRWDKDGSETIEANEGWIIKGTGNKKNPIGDVMVGTDKDDLTKSGHGDDIVCAGDGDDIVQGGHGDDTLFGEAGDDLIKGGHGEDLMNGGDGNDTLEGGHDDDTLNGDAGTDTADGGKATDTCTAETVSDCEA